MILIGLGANLPSVAGPPAATLEAALRALDGADIGILRRSRWYRTAPVPAAADQPWYVNGVAALATRLGPVELLGRLQAVEARFGRRRAHRNAARTLDLDLLDHDGKLREEAPLLPHPRLHQRLFVLRPLVEIAPDWRHPVSGASPAELIAGLPGGQLVEPLGE
jgi:2-amino-4-hydroxy-6-hydroxymethyldihydropteridine diphosphokinase